MDLQQKIKQLALKYHPQTIKIRRHLHQYPELSFNEFNTAKYIQNWLSKWKIPHSTIANTGIIAIIEGKNPSSKTIALRADIDGLPINEQNQLPYGSKNKGIMHACGHDAHTATLLSVARILNNLNTVLEGSIKIIFQPGEEKNPGGASILIEHGVLKNPKPEAIIAQHVYTPLPAGTVGFNTGKAMASCDEIYLTVQGKAGHGAIPHQTIDPILIAAHIITSLQQIVSRRANPIIPTVLTFGSINSESKATNVIGTEVKITGTFRTFDENWRTEALTLIKNMATQIANSMDATCIVHIDKGYPCLINNEALTNQCKQLAIDFLGQQNVHEIPIRMTSEDFAFYSQEISGCFYRLGTGNPSLGINANVHTPTFNIDEDALITSVGLMAWLATNIKINTP